MEALERSMEECVEEVIAPIPRFKPTTIRIARSSRYPVTSEKDQLMKERRYFSCREIDHWTIDCPNKRKPRSKLTVSRMTMSKSEPEKPCIKEPCAKEPLAEKPLIVLSSLLSGDFFAEEALVASCMLGNNGKIRTTALLDTGATGYSFINPAMACRVCNKLDIEPIWLSKPKAIRGFNGKQAPDVTYAIYPTMTMQDHREMVTPMLITKLSRSTLDHPREALDEEAWCYTRYEK